MTFPAPVGGTPSAEDFAPSVLFAVLYGLLVPLMFYRAFDKRSRTTLLIGTAAFGIERIVIFSLRAVQSHNESRRMSKGLLTYMQISFGLGYIGIASDLVNIVRCLLVNPTYGSSTYEQSPAAASEKAEKRTALPKRDGDFPGMPPEGTPDQPRKRFWSRRFGDLASLAFLAATIPGIIAQSRFSQVLDKASEARQTAVLRYVSSGVALFLLIILAAATGWARYCLPRVSRRGTSILLTLICLLTTIAIYRLGVMFHTTTSLGSTAPGTLNSHGSKAGFYILHVLPEWLCNMILFSFKIRRTLATGMFGDWRSADETEKERHKRLKREAKRAEEKKQKLAAAEAESV